MSVERRKNNSLDSDKAVFALCARRYLEVLYILQEEKKPRSTPGDLSHEETKAEDDINAMLLHKQPLKVV